MTKSPKKVQFMSHRASRSYSVSKSSSNPKTDESLSAYEARMEKREWKREMFSEFLKKYAEHCSVYGHVKSNLKEEGHTIQYLTRMIRMIEIQVLKEHDMSEVKFLRKTFLFLNKSDPECDYIFDRIFWEKNLEKNIRQSGTTL